MEAASSSGIRMEEELQDEIMRDVDCVEAEDLIGEWVAENQELQVQEIQVEEWQEEDMQRAWDDVKMGNYVLTR